LNIIFYHVQLHAQITMLLDNLQLASLCRSI
jgi:hypothetical protein